MPSVYYHILSPVFCLISDRLQGRITPFSDKPSSGHILIENGHLESNYRITPFVIQRTMVSFKLDIFSFKIWLVVLACFNHFEKYEFVDGKDDIRYITLQ